MENKDIRELAAIMKDMGLTSIEYQHGEMSVRLTRPAENAPISSSGANTAFTERQTDTVVPENTYTVKSPMVGMFYSGPGVDEDPYVAIGDTVHIGDLLCMIEAMKIMNEITAERDGVITGICVENRQIVEFGQPLFRIQNEEKEAESAINL